MTFQSIVQHWCRIYKPILDNPAKGDRRFFLTDSTAGVVEMVKNVSNKQSPFVLMESDVELDGKMCLPYRNYPIYFFVRANKMNDGDEAAVAKEEAWWHARNFLTYLRAKHDEELAQNINGDFSRIDLDVHLMVSTVGPMENGWYGILVQFEREEPVGLCIDGDLYCSPEDDEEEGTDTTGS